MDVSSFLSAFEKFNSVKQQELNQRNGKKKESEL